MVKTFSHRLELWNSNNVNNSWIRSRCVISRPPLMCRALIMFVYFPQFETIQSGFIQQSCFTLVQKCTSCQLHSRKTISKWLQVKSLPGILCFISTFSLFLSWSNETHFTRQVKKNNVNSYRQGETLRTWHLMTLFFYYRR